MTAAEITTAVVSAPVPVPLVEKSAVLPAVESVELPKPAWRARLEDGLPHLDPRFAGDISVALRLLEWRETRIARLTADLAELRAAARRHLSAGGVELEAALPHTTRALSDAIGGA